MATTDHFTVSIILSFPECHIVAIKRYVAFSDWLLSLPTVPSIPFHDLMVHLFLGQIMFHFPDIVYLSIHLLKGILVTFNFCYKQNAWGIHRHVCFLFFWLWHGLWDPTFLTRNEPGAHSSDSAESNDWTGGEFPGMHRIHVDSFPTRLEQAGWFIWLQVCILLKETPKKPPNCLPKWLYQFCVPINRKWRFPLLHILTSIWSCQCFGF